MTDPVITDFPGGESENETKLRAEVDAISDLPTLPSVTIKVNQLLSDPKSSAADLAQLISTDPAISAKVLRVVNSAFYAMSSPVTSINQAIVILGFRALRELVLSISVYTQMADARAHALFNPEDFWRHSIATAAAARFLAKRLKLPGDLEIYFTAGLLHDLGLMVLANKIPTMFETVINWAQMTGEESQSLYEMEQAALQADHGFIGAILFEKWGLDQDLITVSRFYMQPMKAPPSKAGTHSEFLPTVVHCAHVFARLMLPGTFSGRQLLPVSKEAFGLLEQRGLALSEMPDLLTAIYKEYSGAKVFMAL